MICMCNLQSILIELVNVRDDNTRVFAIHRYSDCRFVLLRTSSTYINAITLKFQFQKGKVAYSSVHGFSDVSPARFTAIHH